MALLEVQLVLLVLGGLVPGVQADGALVAPMIRINAFGIPIPKGSKKIVQIPGRRPILIDDNPHELKAWEASIAGAALAAIHHDGRPRPTYPDQALAVRLELRLKRPKTIKRLHPSVKPDTDKLARPLDALTGLVWTDDAQVCDLHVTKRYCVPGEAPGARIEIEAIEEQQAQEIFHLPAPSPGGE